MTTAKISIVKHGVDPLIVTANSKIKFGSITADVTLSVNSDKEVNFLLGIPFVDVDSFFKALGVNVFGNPITGAFKSFLNVGVKNFALSIIYTHGDMANARIVASGAPIIPGLTKGHIKLVAMVYNPTPNEEDEEEKRSARLPANTVTAPASTRGNQATVPSHRATVPSHQATLSNHQATGMKRSSSRAVTFGIIYPYTRLDRILKDIGFNVHAPWLGEASIIVLASNARKVRCSDPETGKSRICQRSKPVSDIKPEGSKDSSSTRGTERLKKTEEHNHEHKHEHEEEKEEGEEEEEEGEEEESDEDKEEGTQKTLFEDIAEISDMMVAEGLTVRALMKLPSSCQGDMMCKWMQNTLGKNLALQLDATFTITQISLTAMIQMKVALGDLGYMTGFRFELRVGIINSVGVGFNLYIKDIPATITADITLSVGKLELRGTMAGMVLQPFGLKFFAFGDLLLSIGITFAAGLPSFELGAQIWFGGFKDGKDTADTLKFRGYVGIDPSNPNENYFFFESLGADLTIGNVLRALGASQLKLPKLLDESGLYGFLFSLNLGSEDKEIVEFGLVFPPGLRIEGLLNVLGFKIDFKLRFSPEEGSLYLKAEFDPIGDWASGLITFVRSAKEREKGPFLLVDIAPQEAKYVIHIEGLVGLMGRDYYVMVKIHDNGLEFSVGASLFNVLHAQITVKFSYLGGKIGDFAFRGCLGFDLWGSKLVSTLADKLELDKIKEAITAVFDHAKKIADAAFKVAKQAVSWAKSKIQAVRNTINSMRSGISSYQDRLRRRSREIEKEKKALVYSCKSRCGDVCVPFFGWKRKCWKGWWGWHGCVTIVRCKWRVPNYVCIAGCEIGKGIQKMFLYIEQLAVKILLGLTTVADKLLEGVTALSYLGDKVLDVSNHLLDFANKATKALLDLPKYLSKLIVIHNFCVYGNFDPNDQSCVGIHVDVTLIGARFQFEGSLCLDTNIFGNIGKAAAAKKVPEVAKIENDVSEIHTQKDSLKVKVDQMEKEKASTESGVNSETGKSYKRSLVPTQEELIIHEAAFGRIPNHDLRNAQSVGAIQRPWLDSFDMEEYKSEMQRKRSFPRHHLSQEDESKPCELEQTALDRYSKIIDSYHAVVKQTENTEQDYLRLKRSQLNHIDNINKQIQEGLSKYNMTMEEKADLAFWRDTVEQNYESYAKKADEFLKERKRDNIIAARHDLDSMLVTERGMDLPAYMNHLQELRSRSSKKSSIERDTVDKVHEQLYAVVTKDLPYREVAKHLDNARNALSTAKRSSIPCAA